MRTFPADEVKTDSAPPAGATTAHWKQRFGVQGARPPGIGSGNTAPPAAVTGTGPRRIPGEQQRTHPGGNGSGSAGRLNPPRTRNAIAPGGAAESVSAYAGFGEIGSPPVDPICGWNALVAGQGGSHSSFVRTTLSTLHPQNAFMKLSC